MGRFRHRLAHFALFALVALMLSLLADPASADPLDNWHWRNPLPEGNAIDSVVYGNGTFVACAEGGKVLTSSDGVRWSVGGLPVSATSITFEKGTFIARAFTGTDGM